ncbi:MAG: chitobiase/beta-hexosaminidase C-terminal domain-containing protein [Verrucomicrobiales bacterium]|nr:chitobiase/beta-hexosaminidase C-terminal domain-containing protein [Verrucomicrobiales bacterium]
MKTKTLVTDKHRLKFHGERTDAWRKARATGAALFLLLANLTHAQDWQFVFDANGNLSARTAEVLGPPQIIHQPQTRIAIPGEAASFSAVAAITRALNYQWQFKGTNIAGATNDALVVQKAGTTNEGEYRVVLTNPSGSVTSAPAILSIDSDADGQPDSWERLYFSNLNQNATADFDGDGVSNVTEFLDNTNPTNRLSVRYTLTVLTDGNGLVETTPKGASFTNGQSVTLTATPSGTNRFYGWNGSYPSTNNPLVITIASNMTVRAHFQFLPLDIVWTNTGGGDWHSATNWSPHQVPGAFDNAIIPITATVTVNRPAECLGLTLGSVSGNPTLTGSDTLMVHDNLLWTLGIMSGTGRTILNTNVTANIPATVTLSARTLENRGTMFIYNTGGFSVMSGGVLTNCAGALFQVVNETPSLGGGLANGRFDNAGRLEKSSGLGTLIVNPGLAFNNFGTVDIQSGLLLCEGGFTNAGAVNISASTTLRLAGGGSANGSFAASGGAMVEWTKGTFVMNPGTRFEGEGLYRINAGTLLADLDVDLNQLELRNGTLGGNGILRITNRMDWTGGAMTGVGRTVISPGATLQASLPSGGSLNGRILENRGTVLWTGSGNIGFVNAVITNRPGGIFQAQGDGGMTFVSGANRFDNAGTFRKSLRNGTLEIVDFTRSGSFNNFGSVELQAGTLLANVAFTNSGKVQLAGATTNRLAGGGSASGTFETPATGLVEWTGGTFTLNPGAQLNGAGQYQLNGISATVVGDGDLAVENLNFANGSSTWSGSGSLAVHNILRWTAGTMAGAGRTLIGPKATMSIANPNGVGLQRILENAGTVAWSGPGLIGLLNGTITNRAGAVFEVSHDGRFAFSGGSCRFDNAGTFRKLVGLGTAVIDAGIPFNNSGTVDLRSGVLAANGGYLSSETSLLRLTIGGMTPGADHAQLRLPGTINLTGSLEAMLLPGFSAQVNQSFVVITAGNRTGSFERFLYPSNSVTLLLSNTPNAVVVLVKEVLSEVPSPELLPPSVIANNLLLTWSSRSNITYRLEFTPELSEPITWIPVAGDVLATSNTASRLDPLTVSNRFYRVRVLP